MGHVFDCFLSLSCRTDQLIAELRLVPGGHGEDHVSVRMYVCAAAIYRASD